MDSNRLAVVGVLETTPGTRVEPIASDSDIVYIGSGQVVISNGIESLGKLLDGTFDDAPVAGGKKTMSVPDYMFEIKTGLTPQDEPKWYKDAKACGGKVVDYLGVSDEVGILFDGTPSCNTLSINATNGECGQRGVAYKGRGMRGNFILSIDGSNAPLMAKISGMQGALVSRTELVSSPPITVVGDDKTATEVCAKYVFTLGSTVYQIHTLEFDNGNGITFEGGNSDSGVVKSKITSKDKRLKITATMLDSGDTVLEDAQNLTVYDTITLTGGSGAGLDVVFSGCQQLDPTIGDLDGTVTWEIETIVKSCLIQQKDK